MVVGGTLAKKTVRATKSVTKGYSNTQSKVRNATKNDPSSPTSREMSEISALTYTNIDFIEIMEVLDKRLNDKGKLWRHVFKALSLINHLLHTGSPNVFHYCAANLYVFKTLREFQYIDDNGVDVGVNVRSEAKEVTSLLVHPETLKRGRNGGKRNDYDEMINEGRRRSEEEEEAKRKQQERKQKRTNDEEQEMKRAILLSKEEEARRLQAIENSNKGGLFNDLESPSKNSDLIDFSDITIQPSPPLQIQYTQVPVQQQYTAYPLQQQYTAFPQQQPQYTSYTGFQVDPQYTYGAQQEAMQAEYLRQQAEWQAHAQAQQQAQYQQILQTQQTSYSQPIAPQPTAFASNNPFGPGSSPSPALSTVSGVTSMTTASSSSSHSRMSPSTPFSARSASSRPGTSLNDERHPQIAGLFAGRTGVPEDGVDTFGNVGQLRFGPITGAKTGAPGGVGGPLNPQKTAVF